ncbi:MAG: tetratricopeptide repeat protein [Bacteroidales bacterium]
MKKLKIVAFVLLITAQSGLSIAQVNSLDEAKKLTVREQYAQAEDMFKKLIEAEPTKGDNYYYYGENELRAFFSDTITRSLNETVNNCKKIFTQGLEKDPQNMINYIGIARISYIGGFKLAVDEAVNKVIATLPPMDTKIKKIPDPKRYAQMLTEIAKVYIVLGNTDTTKALPLLRRAAQADQKNAEIFITTGDAYFGIKDVNNAIANYNIAQSLDPNSPLAKLRIGYLYVRAKNLPAAIQSLEDALKIDPNFAPAYKELGFVYSLAGKSDKSKVNYSKYLELSGNNIPAKISYVISLFKSGDYNECINQINEIFAVDSTINSMNRVIAYSYYEVKKYDRAHYYMEKFLKNINYDPNKTITKDYMYYGRILGERGFNDRADQNLRIAIGQDATLNYLFTDISNYYDKSKEYKKASQALEDKITAKAARLADYYNLGKIYYKDSAYQKCVETFDVLLNNADPKAKAYELPALSYQSYAKENLDTAMITGEAIPVLEKLIEKSRVDTVKNSRYLIDSYSYMGSFYLFSKPLKDLMKSKRYFLMVLAIDPANKQAQAALKHPDLAKLKLPEEK